MTYDLGIVGWGAIIVIVICLLDGFRSHTKKNKKRSWVVVEMDIRDRERQERQ